MTHVVATGLGKRENPPSPLMRPTTQPMLRVLLVSHGQDWIAHSVNNAGITTTIQEIVTLKMRRQQNSVLFINQEPLMDALVPWIILY